MPLVASIGTYVACSAVPDRHVGGTTLRSAIGAAKRTFPRSGITPSDTDVAEVHHSLTGAELIGYEELGFVNPFETDPLSQAEVATGGGQLPVYPSGRRTAGCHPQGVAGRAPRAELFGQLRGAAIAVSAVTTLAGPSRSRGTR